MVLLSKSVTIIVEKDPSPFSQKDEFSVESLVKLGLYSHLELDDLKKVSEEALILFFKKIYTVSQELTILYNNLRHPFLSYLLVL